MLSKIGHPVITGCQTGLEIQEASVARKRPCGFQKHDQSSRTCQRSIMTRRAASTSLGG